MSFRQLTVSGLPAIALQSAEVEVVVVPGAGMRLTNLRHRRGREWLWRNDQIPLGPPDRSGSYAETGDAGGWDECFPTVGASPVPGAPGGTPPPLDHGELWRAEWTAGGPVLPYEFSREVTLDPDEPVVRLRYRLRHTGSAPFPWIWSAYPLFNVQPGSSLELPTVSQVTLAAVHRRDDLAPGDVVSWPGAVGGDAERLVLPAAGGWALKLFGDVGGAGRMVLTDPRRGERLEIGVRPDEVPQVGVWINCGGWAPPGRRPYYNLALQPSIGAPDRLEDAVRDWGTGQMLAPGEERGWGVEVRLQDGEG